MQILHTIGVGNEVTVLRYYQQVLYFILTHIASLQGDFFDSLWRGA